MLAVFLTILHTLAAFIVVISIIIFIHEFGHYIVAKMCGVRITTFSIGFGKELFGWNDKSGTRWRVAALPLGGYVKMFGDSTAASTADAEAMDAMSEDDKKVTFHHKKLWQKSLIVMAGPAFNFMLSIAIFTYFIATNGLASSEPIAGKILENSAAAEAGLQVGDRITMIDDKKVYSFSDIPYYISTNINTAIKLKVERGDEKLDIILTPKQVEEDDGLGNKMKRPLIGIGSREVKYKEVGFFHALGEAANHTYRFCVINLRAIGQLITGQRSPTELKGMVGIAQVSGQAANKGLDTFILIIANLSAAIGLFNLFPIPVLDGGHLLFYTIEAIFRRPLAEKVQEWSFKVGFALVACLMAFTLVNDIRKLFS